MGRFSRDDDGPTNATPPCRRRPAIRVCPPRPAHIWRVPTRVPSRPHRGTNRCGVFGTELVLPYDRGYW